MAAPPGSEDATLTRATEAGQVLGTLGYLSPEQARGEPVDGRSDLFSLGCVLYEALTGRRAFGGRTPSDHVAAVLKDEPPDPVSLRPEAPAGLGRVVQRCLAKEREARFQSASDLAVALGSFARGAAADRAPAARAERPARGGFFLALGLGLAGLAAGYLLLSSPAAPEPVVLALTPGTGREASPAISPDGKFVAYLASEGDRTDVWVKFVLGGPGANLTVSRSEHKGPRRARRGDPSGAPSAARAARGPRTSERSDNPPASSVPRYRHQACVITYGFCELTAHIA